MPILFYVDDSRDDLFYIDYIRKKQKVDVDLFCFSTAEAAFEALEEWLERDEGMPDILVADLYMPLDSGTGLIARLRRDERFSGMRLGICSGSDAVEDRERALAAGADFYLEKPLDLAGIMDNR
ncbi:CheY-like chemotaxis protein [Rhizobium sp. BK650]|uniref:response regulator n=1 Tax=Rhizobium sp. BK650 TaxID=2586990 RepID=UPI0016190F72|nr:response regulator [Rhizobium sp. BK650]MBB3656210.1 CheY-like chemotaxis protein [Rhizobium sp. BK650]